MRVVELMRIDTVDGLGVSWGFPYPISGLTLSSSSG